MSNIIEGVLKNKDFQCDTPLDAQDLNAIKNGLNNVIDYINNTLLAALAEAKSCCDGNLGGGVGPDIPEIEINCNDINLYSFNPSREIGIDWNITLQLIEISSNNSLCSPFLNITFEKNETRGTFEVNVNNDGNKLILIVEFLANISGENKYYELIFNNSKTITIKHQKKPITCDSFSLSLSNLVFNSEGETKTITISGLAEECLDLVSIDSDCDWVTTSRNGNEIRISVSNNPNEELRGPCNVTIRLNNGFEETVVVRLEGQEHIPCTITIDDNNRSVTLLQSENYIKEISFTSNCEVTITQCQPWLRCSIENGKFKLEAVDKKYLGDYDGIVTLSTIDENLDIEVILEAYHPIIDCNDINNYNINYSPTTSIPDIGGTITITYTIPEDCEDSLIFDNKEGCDWITSSEKQIEGNQVTIILTVSENPNTSDRDCNPVIKTNGGLEKIIPIRQNGKIDCSIGKYNVSPSSFTISAEGKTGNIITYNVLEGCPELEIISSNIWINNILKNSDLATFTVEPNTLTDPRTGGLTVSANSSSFITIPVTLNGIDCSIGKYSIVSGENNSCGYEGGNYSFVYNKPENCPILSWISDSWITITDPNGYSSVSYTVEPNTGTTSRTGYIYPENNNSLKVTVIQEGKPVSNNYVLEKTMITRNKYEFRLKNSDTGEVVIDADFDTNRDDIKGTKNNGVYTVIVADAYDREMTSCFVTVTAYYQNKEYPDISGIAIPFCGGGCDEAAYDMEYYLENDSLDSGTFFCKLAYNRDPNYYNTEGGKFIQIPDNTSTSERYTIMQNSKLMDNGGIMVGNDGSGNPYLRFNSTASEDFFFLYYGNLTNPTEVLILVQPALCGFPKHLIKVPIGAGGNPEIIKFY